MLSRVALRKVYSGNRADVPSALSPNGEIDYVIPWRAPRLVDAEETNKSSLIYL